MKRLLLFFLLAAQSAFGAESVMVDSATRNVINAGTVNFAINQLLVDGVPVIGGAGGGGGGSGPGFPSMPGHNGQFLQTDGNVALWATVSFASLSGKPTTLAGYGITDGVTTTNFTWANLGGKPTTLSGFGITDAQPLDSDLTAIAALSTQTFGRGALEQSSAVNFRTYIGAGTSNFSGAFSGLTGIPTTLAGYGITDAQPLDPDLTSLAAASGTNTMYYRSASNTWSAVTIGTNLTFTGGTLSGPTGLGTGDVSSNVSSSGVGQVPVFADTSGKLLTLQTFTGIATLSAGVLGATSAIGPTQGGTGQTAVTTGDILYGSGTNTWSRLPANSISTNTYLRSVNAGIPSWQQIPFSDLSSKPTSLSGYGITDALAKANNLSELQTTFGNPATAGTARTNLGVAIGSDVEKWDADLDQLAGFSSIAGSGASGTNIAVPYRQSAGPVWSTITLGSGLSFDATTGILTGTATGTGDVTSNTTASIDGEVALFNGTTGKQIKRAGGTGIATVAAGVLGVTSNNSTNWDTAFTDRLKWDGGATGLTASTGRTSLGATTTGSNLFTLATPGATSWLEVSSAGLVTATNAATTKTDLGLVIGTNIQAWDLDLDQLAAFGSVAVSGAGSNTTPINIAVPYRRTAVPQWTNISIGNGLNFDATTGLLTAIVGGTGDVTSNVNLSTPGEAAIFADASGKVITRAILNTGVATISSGVLGSTPQLGVTQGGTGLAAASVGDILYGSGTNAYSRLAGPTLATPARYLRSVGTGSVAQAPTWTQVPFSELSGIPTTLGGYGITDGVSVVAGQVSSVDGEITLYSAATGRVIKRATGTGIVTANAPGGVYGTTANNSTNWDTAFTDRLKWDGGATGLTAATGRTSLGGTTVGQNFFTLTNPSAITFPKIDGTNAVIAESAATYRTSLGATTTGSNLFTVATPAATSWLEVSSIGVVTATDATTTLNHLDPDLASIASIGTTGVIPYRSGTNTWGTVAIGAGLSFTTGTLAAAPGEGYFSDDGITTGTNGSPSLWPTGSNPNLKKVAREAASAPLTVTHYTLLPAANTFPAGTVLTYIDDVTTANFGRVFRPTGSDTINGLGTDVAPFIAGGLGGSRKAQTFETNGSTGWMMLGLGTVNHLEDPIDATKRAVFSIDSTFPTVTTRNVNIATSADSSTAVSLPKNTIGAVAGTPTAFIDSFNAITGAFGTDPVHVYDLVPTQDDISATKIVANAYTVSPNNGQVDSVRLSASIMAPLTITWPSAALYQAGETIRFYDATGSITSTNNVTVGNSTDNFNGGPNTVISEQFANRNFVADPGDAAATPPRPPSWTISQFSGPNQGVTIAYAGQLTEDTANHKMIWTAAPGVTWQTGIAKLTGNDTLVVNGLTPGMHFELAVVQPPPGTGPFTLTLPFGSLTPSDGKGGIALDTAPDAITKLTGTYYGAQPQIAWMWESILNYTATSLAGCSTPGDTNGTGLTSGLTFDNGSGSVYTATSFAPTSGHTAICRLDIGLYYVGTPVAGQTINAVILSDTGGATPTPTSTVLGTSGSVSASSIGKTITDGVITVSGTVTNLQSTSYTFTAQDVGGSVTGAALPSGTTITAFVDGHNVTLSQGAASGATTLVINSQASAVAFPVSFLFSPGIPGLTAGTTYWVAVHVSSFSTANHPNWASQSTGTADNWKAPEPVSNVYTWSGSSQNAKLYFKTYTP